MTEVRDGAFSVRWCVSPDCHYSRCASACVTSRGNTFSRRSSRACACCRRARWRGCASGRSARARSSQGSVVRSSSASDVLNVRCTWFSDATFASSDAVTSRITNLASARLAPDAATRVDGRLVWKPWASSSFCPCHGLLLDHPCTFSFVDEAVGCAGGLGAAPSQQNRMRTRETHYSRWPCRPRRLRAG
jgi:hypothetical protein